MRKYVYLLVTDDVDELPVAQFDTVKELAEAVKTPLNKVFYALNYGKSIKRTGYKPVRVKL